MSKLRITLIYLACILGFLQIIGTITGLRPIKNLGFISASSPLPFVFSEVKGVETFASDFYIIHDLNGKEVKQLITPLEYSQLTGPYNRKNVYGAAIAYAPVLPHNMREEVMQYALCNGILDEIVETHNSDSITILVKSRTYGDNREWKYKVGCGK